MPWRMTSWVCGCVAFGLLATMAPAQVWEVGNQVFVSGDHRAGARFGAAIALGDFASYYLALEYGQDPTPVAMVEDLKHRLTE